MCSEFVHMLWYEKIKYIKRFGTIGITYDTYSTCLTYTVYIIQNNKFGCKKTNNNKKKIVAVVVFPLLQMLVLLFCNSLCDSPTWIGAVRCEFKKKINLANFDT